jgi:GTP-binding protein LepA
VFTPKRVEVEELGPGEIGFLTASIKEVADTRVGDTITDDRKPTENPLPGFRPAIPVVFCGLFPVDAADFENLRAAMGKLRLNDASFSFEMETSAALDSRHHPDAGRLSRQRAEALPGSARRPGRHVLRRQSRHGEI